MSVVRHSSKRWLWVASGAVALILAFVVTTRLVGAQTLDQVHGILTKTSVNIQGMRRSGIPMNEAAVRAVLVKETAGMSKKGFWTFEAKSEADPVVVYDGDIDAPSLIVLSLDGRQTTMQKDQYLNDQRTLQRAGDKAEGTALQP